jgi:hypothetical protein
MLKVMVATSVCGVFFGLALFGLKRLDLLLIAASCVSISLTLAWDLLVEKRRY